MQKATSVVPIEIDNEYDQFFVEVLTTDRVYEIQAAERVEEFQ